nr:hypothetical protein [Corynebacterium xerosis]
MEQTSVFDRVTEAAGVRSTLEAAARAARAMSAGGDEPGARGGWPGPGNGGG